MTLSTSVDKTLSSTCLIIIILPFLIFYWMAPFIANLSIGQDYQSVSIQYQMELLFSIKAGSFPLYVPGFALGHSSSALTLGQVYHPLPHIASMLPGYWDGKALQWNTFLRLLSLGLTHLALFVFLRKIKINTLFSFLLAFITVYNLRMLDLFRYGASLEAYTGHLLLCTAVGWYFINPTRWRGPLSIIGLTYWLICSGHPQMMYYGLFGAGLFTIVAPFFISTILPGQYIDFKVVLRFWIRIGIYLVIGILLSSAYILPFYFDFVTTNAGRVGQGYAWADGYRDTFIGTLNSFFLPFRSDVHGNFGGSSLFLIAMIFPILRLFRVKMPNSIWSIWVLLLLSFLYMQGARTPVHRLAWEYLPFASSFRVAGRISMIMPIFIMMILAWLVQAESFPFRLKSRSVPLTPLTVLTSAAILVMAGYFLVLAISFLFQSRMMLDFAHFIPVNIREVPRIIEFLVILSGAATLFTLTLHGTFPKKPGILGIILCVMTFIHVGSILKYGTWIAERHDKPSYEQILSQKKEKLDYRHHPGNGLYSSVVDTQVRRSFVEPFLGKIYFDVIPSSGQEEVYSMMQENLLPQRIYVEDYEPKHSSLMKAEDIIFGKGTVELVYSSFNRLRFRVLSSAPALFGLSYPYTGHWNAWVNGSKVRLYRANGASHAIPIPEGESHVEFRYWSSAASWGMILSCVTFMLISLYVCFRSLGGLTRVASVVAVLFISIGGYWLWHLSVYTGDDLGTEYTWEYIPPPPVLNIAYGKRTSLSSPMSGGFSLLNHSSRAIDGNLTPDSGFSTALHDNPSWTVDLHKAEKIQSILLHESSNDKKVNIRPLNLALSLDGEQWRTVAVVTSKINRHSPTPTRIAFETHQTARYIRIQATGYCRLSLDEVEVYGPEGITN